jgi:hypothetical protein
MSRIYFHHASASNFDPGDEATYMQCNNGQATYSIGLYPGLYDVELQPYYANYGGSLPPFSKTLVQRIQVE